ncbi:MAG: hypothetical protein KAS04_01670 [Candidatus Aenigmarchaeota archaeon]|nr:hypothetical protein [Candidatus Aenigmarchaeota archaeon]
MADNNRCAFDSIEKWRKDEMTHKEVIECWVDEFGCTEDEARGAFDSWWDFRLFTDEIAGILSSTYKKE